MYPVNLTKQKQIASLVNMTKIIKLYDAKTQLSNLIDRAAAGEEFIIAKGKEPMARLVPFASKAKPRAAGGWEGRLHVSNDFDNLLPAEIQRQFEDPS
jgi:Antitoxin of toxin-antitoxin stability system